LAAVRKSIWDLAEQGTLKDGTAAGHTVLEPRPSGLVVPRHVEYPSGVDVFAGEGNVRYLVYKDGSPAPVERVLVDPFSGEDVFFQSYRVPEGAPELAARDTTFPIFRGNEADTAVINERLRPAVNPDMWDIYYGELEIYPYGGAKGHRLMPEPITDQLYNFEISTPNTLPATSYQDMLDFANKPAGDGRLRLQD